MKKVVILLMFVKVLVASSLEVSDGNVTITIGGKKTLLPLGATIDLDKNVTVCYVSGEGTVLIDDMSRSSKSKDKCYTTEKDKEFDLRKIIDSYLPRTVLRLFMTSTDNGLFTLFRGEKDEKISKVITLQAEEEHLIIESNKWSSYPITLTVHNTQKIKVKQITKYINDYDDTMIFDLNCSVLGEGYSVTVQDIDRYTYIDIVVKLK